VNVLTCSDLQAFLPEFPILQQWISRKIRNKQLDQPNGCVAEAWPQRGLLEFSGLDGIQNIKKNQMKSNEHFCDPVRAFFRTQRRFRQADVAKTTFRHPLIERAWLATGKRTKFERSEICRPKV